MSLVHESLVSVLGRRFVSTYYNAFVGRIGADAEAAAFVNQGENLAAIGGARYGLIMTPEGKALVSFGFDRDGFVAALKQVLKSHPDYMWATPAERSLMAAAAHPDAPAAAHLAAATLRAELLDDAGARKHIDVALAKKPGVELTARAYYLRGHLAALDLERQDAVACRRDFAAMGLRPTDLEDDVALDLVSLDIRLRPARGFFTGWEFKPGTDVKAHATRLERWIGLMPESNRIGQMHFFLGLARFGLGDKAGADKIWTTHFERYPNDRFAMLSRIHHSGYQFSPSRRGPAGAAGGVLSTEDLEKDPERIRQILKALESGAAGVQGGGAEGREQMKRMFRQMLKRAEAAAKKKAKGAGAPEVTPGSGG